MPEIKNTFLQGKMNKDLDERLIPNGQYRHAENIDVSISEGSDVGTVQNILGNAQIDGGIIPLNCTCIGSVIDENRNQLYWFVRSVEREAIVRYDEESGSCVFMAVDMSMAAEPNVPYPSFLKFPENRPITAINVIDDFLFWTDGFSEPKKININQPIDQYPATINAPSRLYVNGVDEGFLEEKHVTVIRKKPSIAPSFEITTSTNTNLSPIFEKVLPRFCFRYKYQDGEYSAFGPFTDVVFNPKYIGLINKYNAFNIGEPYNRAMVNSIASIDLYNFVPADIPDSVVQVDILYKQENSPIVYSIANIKPSDDEWTANGYTQGVDATTNHKGKYTITTENIHAAVSSEQMLRPWDNVPRSALAQEIIGNRLVYGNYVQGYNVADKPLLSAALELRENQDFEVGGLRSLKSLRNYQVGVVFGDEYGRETPVFTSDNASLVLGWADSILGNLASRSLMLNASVNFDTPAWADYYKFYIKQTSGEYYNLIMENAYISQSHTGFENKGDHAWISFASADRNKLVEDDFIIVKKVITPNPEQIAYNNRYKILDIANEAPDAVKYIFSKLGHVVNTSGNVLTTVLSDDDFRIDKEVDMIYVSKDEWLTTEGFPNAPLHNNAEGGSLIFANDEQLYISWKAEGQHSERYKVTNCTLTSDNIYKLKLNKAVESQDQTLAAEGAANDSVLNPSLTFTVERREDRSKEDFSGKFFVKIKRDASLSDTIGELEDQFNIGLSQDIGWLYSPPLGYGNWNEADGAVNATNVSYPAPTNYPSQDIDDVVAPAGWGTDENPGSDPDEWVAISNSIGDNFFIDSMPFVSSNPSYNNAGYARESGEGWKGVSTTYTNYYWGFRHQLMEIAEGDSAGALIASYTDVNPDEDIQELEPNGKYTWLTYESGLDNMGATAGPIPTNSITENAVIPEAYYYGTPGGHGFAPNPYWPKDAINPGEDGVINTEDDFIVPNANKTRLINSLEGIVTTNTFYTTGGRLWKTDTIYDTGFPFDTTYTANPTGGSGGGGDEGRYFIHLSFLAPGVDLHSGENWGGDGLPGVELMGKDSIAKLMQGIHGGGIFSNQPSIPQPQTLSDNPREPLPLFTIGDTVEGIPFVEFEGNYDADDVGLEEAPSLGVGKGYDAEYLTRHQRQWDPAYNGPGAINQAIQAFIDLIELGDQKFKFSDDESNTEYQILQVRKKKLYNHTSWRQRWIWDDDNEKYGAVGNSVEEAAVAWARAKTGGTEDELEKANNLKDVIENFGSKENRRVCYIIEVDKDPNEYWNPINTDTNEIDLDSFTKIQFINTTPQALTTDLLTYPAVWETEPQQLVDLNIYYEASQNIPTNLDINNVEVFAPAGCKAQVLNTPNADIGAIDDPGFVVSWSDEEYEEGVRFTLSNGLPHGVFPFEIYNYNQTLIKFTREDGSYTIGRIIDLPEFEDEYPVGTTLRTDFLLLKEVDTNLKAGLSWYNSICFGDGVESNRIRDKYNDMQIFNGAKASATLEEPYSEERRKSGLIYSGIYNSNSGVNNLNQFIQAQKITKDLNPTYGSIQKLFSRNTDLVAFCEDRVLKILASKDALFNADGNPQLVATENVLGQATPFVGDFGISQNPESFASESYRVYFADKQRNSILRLSMDGLTPISDAGMRDWFRDNIGSDTDILGSYDEYSKQYNVTVKPKTYPNIILNATALFGHESEEFYNLSNFLLNSFMNSGVSLSDIAPGINLDDGKGHNYELMPFDPGMSSFDTNVTIYNHHEINIGDIIAGTDAQEEQEFVPSEFTLQFPNEHWIFSENFTTFLSLQSLGGTSDTSIPAVSTKKNILLMTDAGPIQGGEQIWNGGGNAGETPGMPSIFASNGLHFTNLNWQDWDNQPAFEQMGGAALYPQYSIKTPEQWGDLSNPTTDVGQAVTIAWWDAHVPQPILDSDAYGYGNYVPHILNNTIFNGEEIRISFDVRATVLNSKVLQDYIQLGQSPGQIIFNLSLYDGAQFGLADGVGVHSPPFTLFNTPATPYNKCNFGNAIAIGESAVGGSVGPWTLEYPTSTSVDFPPMAPVGLDIPQHFTAYFKFTDGTENEGVVVDRLVVKITARTEQGEFLNDILIKSLDVSKVYSLKKPEQSYVAASPNIDPVPFEYIPAWAEIVYAQPEWSTLGGNIDMYTGQFNIFGSENPGEYIDYVETILDPYTGQTIYIPGGSYYTGVTNGVTEYNQYPGDPYDPYTATDTYNSSIIDIDSPQSIITINPSSNLSVLDNIGYIMAGSPGSFDYFNDSNIGDWIMVDIEVSEQEGVSYDYSDMSMRMLPYSGPYGNVGTSDFDLPNGWEGGAYIYDNWVGSYVQTYVGLRFVEVFSNNVGYTLHPGSTKVFRIKFQITEDNFLMNGTTALNGGVFGIRFGAETHAVLNKVTAFNITLQNQLVPIPTNWTVQNGENGLIPQTTVDIPDMYYDYGMVNWWTQLGFNTEENNYGMVTLAQPIVLGSDPATINPINESADGYELIFEIKTNPDYDELTGGFVGIQGSLRGYVGGEFQVASQATNWVQSHFDGFGFSGISEPGIYKITGNINSSSPVNAFKFNESLAQELQVDESEIFLNQVPAIWESYTNIQLGGLNSFDYPDQQNQLHANRVAFLPDNGGFTGSIDNVHLNDVTNYFTTSTINDWTIGNIPTGTMLDPYTGEEVTVPTENWIHWDPSGEICFENAPGAQMSGYTTTSVWLNDAPWIGQNIGYINEGEALQISFLANFGDLLVNPDLGLTNTNLVILYFNSDGAGFHWGAEGSASLSIPPFGPSTQSQVVTVGDNHVTPSQLQNLGIPLNTFIIAGFLTPSQLDSGDTITGCVDNVIVRRFLDRPSYTLSFSEDVKGWVSFKSFIPESGISLSSKYFTMNQGALWQHNANENGYRGSFYGMQYPATITAILNDSPSTIKSFNTLSYEGSRARSYMYGTVTAEDGTVLSNFSNQNMVDIDGWYCGTSTQENGDGIFTNIESGSIRQFVEKEDKWFNYIRGTRTIDPQSSIGDFVGDRSKLNFQGLGIVQSTE